MLATVIMNSTTTTTTTTTPATYFHLNDTIETYPFCSRKLINCPFLEPSLGSTVIPTTFAPTTNVPTTTMLTKQVMTTLMFTPDAYTTIETSSTKDYVHDDFNSHHNGSTFNPIDDNNWTWPDSESITDGIFETVDGLQITGNYSVSSEITAVESAVSSVNHDDLITNISTTDSVTMSSASEPITIPVTEPTASLETEMIPNTTTDESVFTTRNECNNCTITYDRRTDNVLSTETRKKRTSEIIFDGTHCFQVTCSPRPPSLNVTEVPKEFREFKEKSSKYFCTKIISVYIYVCVCVYR